MRCDAMRCHAMRRFVGDAPFRNPASPTRLRIADAAVNNA
jgi:hypothetical protein